MTIPEDNFHPNFTLPKVAFDGFVGFDVSQAQLFLKIKKRIFTVLSLDMDMSCFNQFKNEILEQCDAFH